MIERKWWNPMAAAEIPQEWLDVLHGITKEVLTDPTTIARSKPIEERTVELYDQGEEGEWEDLEDEHEHEEEMEGGQWPIRFAMLFADGESKIQISMPNAAIAHLVQAVDHVEHHDCGEGWEQAYLFVFALVDAIREGVNEL